MKSKAVASEMILTIGILIAVGIVLLQLRGVFYSQERLSQEEIIVGFANDLESIIQKAIASTGNAAFTYHPLLKKYILETGDDKISIYDKISGKNVSFIRRDVELVPNKIEDYDAVCVMKILPATSIISTPCRSTSMKYGIAGHWWWLQEYEYQFIQFYNDLGVTNVRLGIDWAQFDKPDGYDWSLFDTILPPLEENGIEVVGLFVTVPPYLSDNPDECANNQSSCILNRNKTERFEAAVGAVVKKYPQIKYWEFWNEPEMWETMKSPEEYNFWLTKFYDTVKYIDSNKLVAANTLGGWDFISSIYNSGKFDAIGYHPYSSSSINKSEIERIRNGMVNRGDRNKKIWLTEFGWQSPPMTQEDQAKNLEDALTWIKQQDYIEVANLHMLHDWENENYGLVTIYPNFSEKLSYSTFKKFPKDEESQSNIIAYSKIIIDITPGECKEIPIITNIR